MGPVIVSNKELAIGSWSEPALGITFALPLASQLESCNLWLEAVLFPSLRIPGLLGPLLVPGLEDTPGGWRGSFFSLTSLVPNWKTLGGESVLDGPNTVTGGSPGWSGGWWDEVGVGSAGPVVGSRSAWSGNITSSQTGSKIGTSLVGGGVVPSQSWSWSWVAHSICSSNCDHLLPPLAGWKPVVHWWSLGTRIIFSTISTWVPEPDTCCQTQ